MNKEIERKFLVKEEFKHLSIQNLTLTQGYLSSIPERVVRIRTKNQQGYITIKGKNDSKGLSRFEWEKEIPFKEAQELLKLCEPRIIEKTRYLIPVGKHIFEVDEFYGENEGLIIAEIELTHENEEFEKPAWLGAEVTGETKYYNSQLKKHPYTKW